MTNMDGLRNPHFKLMLIDVEVSADMLSPDEDLWVTSRWQNVGGASATERLYGFADMEFGHQRTVEARDVAFHRVRWEPHPGIHMWRPGEVWATACRCRIPGGASYWGGTYRLFLGVCDGDGAPIAVLGPGGKPMMRVEIGQVESGWGWGVPTMELQRKPWSRSFNSPHDFPRVLASRAGTIEIGPNPAVLLAKDGPRLLRLGELDLPGFLPEITVRDKRVDCLYHSCQEAMKARYSVSRFLPDAVSYFCDVEICGTHAVGFCLRFAVEDNALLVSLEDVAETGGYELIEVGLPALAAMSGPGTHLVDFHGDGKLVQLGQTAPVGYTHAYDIRNAAALFDQTRMLVMEDGCLDDKLHVGMMERNGVGMAALGVTFTHRIRARGALASIPAGGHPRVRIALPGGEFGRPSWQAAARYLRQGVRAGNVGLYRRASFTRYHVTQGPALPAGRLREDSPYGVRRLSETHSFDEVLDMVGRVYHLTGGAPQIVYIAGWQYRGFDTGYPYVVETDPRAGTAEDLRRCIAEGRRYNALIGMHDNYDDCYPSPHLDESMVSRDEAGGLWRGWIWAGGQSYILGLPKYVKRGLMAQRVRDTVALYGINTTYHLDVLSSEVRHYDFDPEYPSASADYLAAKLQVICEFNGHGVDVTSETVSHPFVGHIGYAANTRSGHGVEVLFPGERSILLTAMIYHGAIRYDGAGTDRAGILRGILSGASSGWVEDAREQAACLRGYYLNTFPMGLLADRPMLDVVENGAETFVDYGGGSHVRANAGMMEYEITVDGRVVGRDFTSFAPGFLPGQWLAYSMAGGELVNPAPQGWEDGCALDAVALTGQGDGPAVGCRVEGGCIHLEMPAGVPVRICGPL